MTPDDDVSRPAFSHDSAAVKLPGVVSLDDLTPAWAWGGATGRGVRVAIVDSGVEADHPALDGCVDADAGIAFSLQSDGTVAEQPGRHPDSFGHATACA